VRARFSFDPSHEERSSAYDSSFSSVPPGALFPCGLPCLVQIRFGADHYRQWFFTRCCRSRIHLPASLRSSDHYSPSFPGGGVLPLSFPRLACATADALTAAAVRFFGRVLAQHELRPLAHGSSPMFSAHHFESRSVTNHPTSPVRPPFPVLCGFRLFRSFTDLASFFESSLANLPGRIVFTLVTDRRSRTRLLQTPPRGDALTLCFLFFHGLTMQDLHLL
jgi:hypothetical protein